MKPTYIIGDTETTGLRGKVCEIAWIEIDSEFNVLNRVQSLIDPEIPIEPGAMQIHGITDDMVRDAPTIEEFYSVVHPRKYESIVLMAHNVSFDYKFLAPHMPIDGTLCSLQLARKLLPTAANHKLQTLRSELGLPGGEEHRAMGDCISVLALLQHLCKISFKTLDQHVKISENPVMLDVMPYGKHKGEKIADLPKDYRLWLLGTQLGKDLRYTLEQLLHAGL